jgi:MFS family permease
VADLTVDSRSPIWLNRSFRRLFAARSASLLGDGVAAIALTFAVLDTHHGSTGALGAVLFARALTQGGFLLLGGVLADRWPRVRLMIGAEILACAAQTAVASVVIAGGASLATFTALAALSGAAAGLFFPASASILPQLVEPAQLQPANALLRVSINAATLVGAALGGVLVSTVGPGRTLAIDAATFLLSAALLGGIHIRAAPTATAMTLIASLRGGWAEFTARRWVWAIVAQYAVITACFSGCIRVLGPLVAERHFRGALGWSAILSAEAVGFLVGSVLLVRVRPRYPLRVAIFATFGYLPSLILLGVGAPLWVIVPVMVADGICSDTFEVLWATALQQHVPGGALSRVTSYDALGSFGVGAIGLGLAGPIAAAVGVTATFIGAAAVMFVASTIVVLIPSVRSLTLAATPHRVDAALAPSAGPAPAAHPSNTGRRGEE